MNDGNGNMIYLWVIGQYSPSSERGKSVMAHAANGVGYFELNKGRSKGENIVVGFRWSNHKEPVPRYLAIANPEQILTLERMYNKRNGIERKTSSSEAYSAAGVFPGKKEVAV